jgi:hypothetical protein
VFKKEQLIEAMLTGKKEIDPSIGGHFSTETPERVEAEVAENPRPVWLPWSIVVVVGGVVYAVVTKAFF